MGCAWTNPFGEDDVYAEDMFFNMNINKRDLRKLRKVFDIIDITCSQRISIDELMDYFDTSTSSLTKKLFEHLDLDGSGTFTFVEFVCSLWNLLSIDKKNIASLVFCMFDYNNAGNLSFEKMRSLVETIHNQQYLHSVQVRGMVDELRGISKHVTMREFLNFHVQHPSLLEPMQHLQTEVRERVVGREFWCRLERCRLKRSDLLEPHFVSNTYKMYCKKWLSRRTQDRRIKINEVSGAGVGIAERGVSSSRVNSSRDAKSSSVRTISKRQKPSRNSYPLSSDEHSNISVGAGSDDFNQEREGSKRPKRRAGSFHDVIYPTIAPEEMRRGLTRNDSPYNAVTASSGGGADGGAADGAGGMSSGSSSKFKKSVNKLRAFSTKHSPAAPSTSSTDAGTCNGAGDYGAVGRIGGGIVSATSEPHDTEVPPPPSSTPPSAKLKKSMRKQKSLSKIGVVENTGDDRHGQGGHGQASSPVVSGGKKGSARRRSGSSNSSRSPVVRAKSYRPGDDNMPDTNDCVMGEGGPHHLITNSPPVPLLRRALSHSRVSTIDDDDVASPPSTAIDSDGSPKPPVMLKKKQVSSRQLKVAAEEVMGGDDGIKVAKKSPSSYRDEYVAMEQGKGATGGNESDFGAGLSSRKALKRRSKEQQGGTGVIQEQDRITIPVPHAVRMSSAARSGGAVLRLDPIQPSSDRKLRRQRAPSQIALVGEEIMELEEAEKEKTNDTSHRRSNGAKKKKKKSSAS